ncbi:MAG: glycosyltransferase [Steroidobacteraceae bacterium]
MKYFVVVQAMAYRLTAHEFAIESAFAVHLQELRARLGADFDELVLIGPEMTPAEHAAAAGSLAVVDSRVTGVRFLPAYRSDVSRPAFLLRHLFPTWRFLKREFSASCVVQSGMSTQLAHPLMFMACLAAKRQGQVVVFMVDIDFRQHSRRYYELGEWGLKSFLINRFVYDPLKWVQLWLAPRLFDLCLFKSRSLVRDFSGGRPNVRNFFDTVHSDELIVRDADLEVKLRSALDASRPLLITYFGRLVPYKGLDRVVRALALARAAGADVRLRIIGDGESRAALEAQVEAESLGSAVEMLPQVPYGPSLFRFVDECHLAVATPLVEDTPRAAFDSMARGLPMAAFDITYFKDLAEASGAVVTTPWPSAEGLARVLQELAGNRRRLAEMSRAAVRFARENTQEVWVKRRMLWTRQLLAGQE